MGYIYKITNKINGKVYVGQTIKNYEERFRQHRLNYNKEYFSQIVLYKAFNSFIVVGTLSILPVFQQNRQTAIKSK